MYGGKPKKTVFDTAQCAHVWAQQTQDWGRNAKGTVYFERETIYSYGSHFPMARFATPEIVLINKEKYSVSTSSHQGVVSGAVRHKKRFYVKNVRAASKSEHESNLADYKKDFESSEKLARNTRANPWRRKYALESLPGIAEAANSYARAFLRKRKNVIELPADFDLLANEIAKADATRVQKHALRDFNKARVIHSKMRGARAVISTTIKARQAGAAFAPIDVARFLRVWRAARKAYNFLVHARKPHAVHAVCTAQGSYYFDKNALEIFKGYAFNRPQGFQRFDRFAECMKTDAEIAAEAERRAQWEAEWEARREREKKQRAEEKAARERLKNASAAELIAYWRQTGIDATSNYALRSWPCMLRIDGDAIVTSWGASFPSEHARRAWPVIKRVFESGKAWHTNGHKIPLGHFKVDSIVPDNGGTLRAGCHTLARAEIELCAAALGLT
jgi:hypothetical protein